MDPERVLVRLSRELPPSPGECRARLSLPGERVAASDAELERWHIGMALAAGDRGAGWHRGALRPHGGYENLRGSNGRRTAAGEPVIADASASPVAGPSVTPSIE